LTGIDKLDKLPVAKVQQELESKGIDPAAAVLAIVTDPQASQLPYLAEVLKDSRQGQNGVAQLQQMLDYLAPYGLASGYKVDLSLARGLDYYTGTIFETVTAANIGSVGGGGRYDKLIETLSGGRVDLPAAGTSLGLDRLLTAMEKLDLFQQIPTPPKILVTFFTNPELAQAALQLVNQLRSAGLPAELYYGESEFKPNALRKQLGYAESRGMSHVLITGPDEVSRGEVTLKSMRARHQENIPLAEVAQHLAQL
jgi:histidyl-tRNA synthetase